MKETEVKTSAEMGRRDARKIKVRITVCAGCGSRDATLYKVKDAQGRDGFVSRACMLARQPVMVEHFQNTSRKVRRRIARQMGKEKVKAKKMAENMLYRSDGGGAGGGIS